MREIKGYVILDDLCGLKDRVPGYKSRGLDFDSRPLNFVRTNKEPLERKSSDFGLENRDKRPWGTDALTTRHPSICKSWH
jgi:hypothetical protein